MGKELQPTKSVKNSNEQWRFEYVINSLKDAEELNKDVEWRDELWDGCTVEEIVGALYEVESSVECD